MSGLDLNKFKAVIGGAKSILKAEYVDPEELNAIMKDVPGPEPEETPIPDHILNMTVEIIIDTDHPNANTAEYDSETNRLTIWVREGLVVTELLHKKIFNLLSKGQAKFNITQIAKVEVIPLQVRSCKWFTGSKSLFKSFDLERSESYDFDNLMNTSACGNPVLLEINGDVPILQCPVETNQFSCNYYEHEEWRPVRVYESAESGIMYMLEHTRKHLGFGTYRIVQISPLLGDTILSELSIGEQPDAKALMTDKFQAMIDEAGDDATEKAPVTQKDNPYFVAVLG